MEQARHARADVIGHLRTIDGFEGTVHEEKPHKSACGSAAHGPLVELRVGVGKGVTDGQV